MNTKGKVSRKKKVVLGILIGLLAVLVLGGTLFSYGVGEQVAQGVLGCNLGNDTKSNSISQLEQWQYDLEAFQAHWPEEPFTVTASDGNVVQAVSYKPGDNAVSSTVILVHGHGGDHISVAPLAEMYLKQGYTVLALDQRGTMNAASQDVTFGIKEKLDIEALVDYVKENQPGSSIILHGQSLGAMTIALYADTAHGQQNIDALILDSAVSNMKDMVMGVMGEEGLVGEYMIACGDWYMKWNYGFSSADSNTIEAAASITTPALVIQSSQDDIAPVEVGQAIYAALAADSKAYWEVDSQHIEGMIDFPGEYAQQVFDFLS